jgi:hypothetical protein
MRREEAAGLQAAGIRPKSSLKDTVWSILAAQRDVFRKATVEAELYWFRTRLDRTRSPEFRPDVPGKMAVSDRHHA